MAGPDSRKSLLYSVAVLFLFLFVSCSSDKTLVVEDPLVEHFASESIFLYKLRTSFHFFLNGQRPRNLSFDDPEASDEGIKKMIDSGEYSGVILPYGRYFDLADQYGIPLVVVGGSRDIGGDGVFRIFNNSQKALSAAGEKIRKLSDVDGSTAVFIFWDTPGRLAQEKEALFSAWPEDERDAIRENALILNEYSSDRLKKLEFFLSELDFENSRYVIFVNAPPALEDFFKVYVPHENARLILNIPDTDLLPPGTVGIITPDYLSQSKAAAFALKGDFSPGSTEVDALFLEK